MDGLNVQWPWSQLLLDGKKTIETRSYTIPNWMVGKDVALIETPGPRGLKIAGIRKAQIVGVIRFSAAFQYKSKANWIADFERHRVDEYDPKFAWNQKKPKFGWVVDRCVRLKTPLRPPRTRGYVFAKGCKVSLSLLAP